MKTFNKIILDTDKKLKDDEILTVELSIDDRIKSRIIATTKDGQEVGILTARGTTLRDGTLLSNDDSEYLKVVAALENVSSVRASTPIALTALAYHQVIDMYRYRLMKAAFYVTKLIMFQMTWW